jgi:transposase
MVAIMYIDTGKSKGNKRVLLRTSERRDGKVVHRTIANLSGCKPEELAAITWALRNKAAFLDSPGPSAPERGLERQGAAAGGVWTVFQVARELGIVDALGHDRQGRLALWQVIARVLDQGSRLSAVRLAGTHGACDILGLDAFDEDDLYSNLGWLSLRQSAVEDRMFRRRKAPAGHEVYLYDVTSSYVEGERNAMAAFGYNRDGKKGKMQIVAGLLCDKDGEPLSVEVFDGNTSDCATVSAQLDKIAGRFGGREIVFVGDRGMVRGRQVEDITGRGFHYITGLTKPQIETLLKENVIQMTLFDSELCEVDDGELRYILRRNPARAEESMSAREGKIQAVLRGAAEASEYLAGHAKADPAKSLAKVVAKAAKLRVGSLVAVTLEGRSIKVSVDEGALAEAAKLDGCYVLKTDVSREAALKEIIHSRYKDLAQVEWAFRTSKTGELEMRPLYVRTEASTRGHVFVVMLAYRIIRELAARWRELDLTVEEGLLELDRLCTVEIAVEGKALCQRFPAPRESTGRLLSAARVTLPDALPARGVVVATRKNLAVQRKRPRRQRVDT